MASELLNAINEGQSPRRTGLEAPAPTAGVAGGGSVPSQSAPSPTPPLPEGYNPNGGVSEKAGAFFRGVVDSASFGFSDEIGGFMSTITPVQDFEGQQSIWGSGKGFGDTLAANIAIERAVQKADEANYKGYRIAGQLGGAILVPFGAGAKGAAQVAKVGAVQGAIYGAGSGEGAADRTGKAIGYGAAGGVLGGVLGAVGTKVASLFRKAPEVATGVVDEAAQAGTNAIHNIPEGTILGQTRDGLPIMAARQVDNAGAEVPALTDVMGQAEGKAAEEGLTGSVTAERPAPDVQRESLAKLQQIVGDVAHGIDNGQPNASDITWANSPDVAQRTGEWRIGNLNSDAEANALLGAMARATQKEVRPDADLVLTAGKVADRMGEDPAAILAYAQQVAGDLGDADSAMLALRTVWAKASENVTDLHLMNVDWENASDELVDAAAGAIHNLSLISSQVQKAKTGLGRALRSIQLPSADEYRKAIADGGVYSAEGPRTGNPLPTTRQGISDWMDLWGATGGDPARQSAFLQGTLTTPTAWKYLRQSTANFFTASILSMPRTLALNLIGPGFISTIRQAERISGAAVNSINPLITANERQAARAVAQYSAKAYVQTMGEVGDAFRMALVAAQRNHTIIGGGGQSFDAASSMGPLTDNILAAAGRTPSALESTGYKLGNLLNVFPRGMARLNNGLDEFAKRLSYQGEVRVNAMVEAAQQGLDGDAFSKFVTERMQGAYDSFGHAADDALLREAERTTLTATVGEQGTHLRRFASAIQSLRADIPEVRYILPVFNVPINGITETLRRLPIGAIPGVNNILFKRTAAELAGELGPVAQADAHGRMLLGGAFMMAGSVMNHMGVLTGGGPHDPGDRRIWLQTHQPYSIRIGDEWVAYDKYDIAGALLSIPATVSDMTTFQDDDEAASNIVWSGIGALAQWFQDRSALQNAASLLAFGSDPTKSPQKQAEALLGNVASGFYPAALRGLTTDATANPYQAMKSGWMDYVASVVPGNNVELLRNVLGEPVRKKIDSIPEVLLPVTLASNVPGADNVMSELDRLYQVTGYGAGADTSSFSHGFFADKELKLEDGQSLYSHAMKARQDVTVDGLTLRQALTQLFASPEYKSAVDGDSGRKLTSQGELSRGWMVSQVFQTYNSVIKGNLAQNSEIAKSYMTAAAAKASDDAYLRGVSTDELASNPALYNARGLDKDAYEQGVVDSGSTADLYKAFGY